MRGVGVMWRTPLRLLRSLGKQDTSTEEGRSADRYVRVAMSALSSAATQVIMIGVSLLMVPIALGYLGAERYGLWITLTSVLSIFSFADLGLGNGLLNAIGEANGKNDEKLASIYISTGFFLLSGIAIVLALVGLVVNLVMNPDWGSFFNLKSDLAAMEADTTIVVLFCSFILALPLSVAQRVRMGYQQGYINSVFGSAGSVLGLVGVIVVVSLDSGLPWVAGSVIAAPLVAQLLNSALLLKKRPWAMPRWNLFEADKAKALLRIGVLFFILQLSSGIGFTSDNLVIANILGPEAVTSYAVPLKLFSLAPLALSFVLTPLWPAYREAVTRGDTKWVQVTLHRSIQLGLGMNVPIAIALVCFGRPIVELWSGGGVTPSLDLLIGMGIFVILNGFVGPSAMLLNGLNVVLFQVICSLAMALVNISLSIVLVNAIGVAGAIYGTVIALLLCIVIPTALYIPRLLERLGDPPSTVL